MYCPAELWLKTVLHRVAAALPRRVKVLTGLNMFATALAHITLDSNAAALLQTRGLRPVAAFADLGAP